MIWKAPLAMLLALAVMAAAPPGLTVRGPAGKVATLSPADLADLPRDKVVLQGHAYEGPTMTAIVRAAGAPTGPLLHGKPTLDYVIVTGADGFSAVLSLAETDSWLHKGRVILADHVDGAPLSAHEGPLRLMVEGDGRPSRSVRNVIGVEVRQAAP